MSRDALWRGLGFLVGFLILGLLAWRVPWQQAVSALRMTQLSWWGTAVGVGALGIAIRTIRLHLILDSQVPVRVVWRAIVLGYASGLILPVGGGELVKVGFLAREGGLGMGRSTAAVLIDRLMDVAGLAVGISLLSQLQSLAPPMGLVLKILGITFILLGFMLVALLSRGRLLIKGLNDASGDGRLRKVAAKGIETLCVALEHFRKPGLWLRLVLLQGAAITIDATGSRILMEALPLGNPPWWAGLQVGCLVQLAFALPLLPGGIGTHQAACILALRPFGIGIPLAIAYSLLGHLGHLLTIVSNGCVALAIGPTPTFPRENSGG
jgi:glycosyltransferase 2 family protein